MSGIALESLQKYQPREIELSPEIMTAQIEAIKNIVIAAHNQLATHQVDRDAGSDWPVTSRRYDAFFKIQEADAVMSISSVGLVGEERENGLFVYIHSKGQDVVNQIVGLQIAKSPNFVNQEEALRLSGYSPNQLELLANIIVKAEPMDKDVYKEYVEQS